MDRFWIIIEVLYKGKELKNKALWKNAQAMTGIFLPMLAAVNVFVPDLHISTMDQHTIVNGLVAVMGVFGTWVTLGSSKTVGLNPKASK